jgi:transcriptional regulator with XRE-family HTH domain
MGRRRIVADNPISRNLDKLLGEGNRKENLKKIEKELGIASTSVQNWINGQRRPLFDSLEKVASLFGVDVYCLLKEDPVYSPDQKEIIDMIMRISNKDVLEALKITAKIGISKKLTDDKNTATK